MMVRGTRSMAGLLHKLRQQEGPSNNDSRGHQPRMLDVGCWIYMLDVGC